MRPVVCSRCGQPIVPAGLSLKRILDIVRRHPGIDAETLRSIVWDGPDGGPEDPKVLHVHVHQLNQRLAPYGVCVRGSRTYGYRLQTIRNLKEDRS
jgi:hypothetical protein